MLKSVRLFAQSLKEKRSIISSPKGISRNWKVTDSISYDDTRYAKHVFEGTSCVCIQLVDSFAPSEVLKIESAKVSLEKAQTKRYCLTVVLIY